MGLHSGCGELRRSACWLLFLLPRATHPGSNDGPSATSLAPPARCGGCGSADASSVHRLTHRCPAPRVGRHARVRWTDACFADDAKCVGDVPLPAVADRRRAARRPPVSGDMRRYRRRSLGDLLHASSDTTIAYGAVGTSGADGENRADWLTGIIGTSGRIGVDAGCCEPACVRPATQSRDRLR